MALLNLLKDNRRGFIGTYVVIMTGIALLGISTLLLDAKVINGFSELMAEVFGEEAGVGARSAVGMGSLPINIPVEIECIFEVV